MFTENHAPASRAVTAARTLRNDRANSTRHAILTAAERLYAEHGVYAVSNRQVSEAAGQGNNAAVGYHFGTKADLVAAIESKHRVPIERLREQMVARTTESTNLREWIACLVCPLTEHLSAMGNPTWYARFIAQAMTDPTYQETMFKDTLASPSLIQVLKGIKRCLPELPDNVQIARSIMVGNLVMHTAAEWERALAEGTPIPASSWPQATSELIDAIVGLWLAPVTDTGKTVRGPLAT